MHGIPLPEVLYAGSVESVHDRASSSALAEYVRRRRRQLGLRQDELAILSGVSTRFLASLEAGKPTLRLTLVLAVLGQLGTDLALVPGTGTIRVDEAVP